MFIVAKRLDGSLGTKVGLNPGDSMLDGDPAPSPQSGLSPLPNFRPISIVAKRWMHQDATWYGGRPQPRGLCVRWGLSPVPKRRRSPQFSAHVYCGQTARWIKMALGVEVGVGSVHIVLDGDTAPLPKKGVESPPPSFGPSLLWPNGWMHQHATWYGGRPHPRRLCVRWGPSPYDWYPAPTLLRLELVGHCNGTSLST